MLRKTTIIMTALALVSFGATARAADEPIELAEDPEDTTEEDAPAAEPSEDPDDGPAATPEDTGAKTLSVIEEDGKTYRFVGLRYRSAFFPQFLQNLFAEGGDTVHVPLFGIEYVVRKDGFEYQLALSYGDYGMDDTLYKASDDPEEAWELVNSELGIIYATADFLWSHPLSPEFSVNYGGGFGLGFVIGDLHRVQAWRDTNGSYHRCTGVNNPGAVAGGPVPVPGVAYCDNENDHYANYVEPTWADGGSTPIIFPWIAIQTGARYKPHPNFVGRLDVGFGLSGFFLGLGADYGLL